jgi:hypothetical protein
MQAAKAFPDCKLATIKRQERFRGESGKSRFEIPRNGEISARPANKKSLPRHILRQAAITGGIRKTLSRAHIFRSYDFDS